jgi:hypothetical protein
LTSFPICIPFISLSCLISLAKNSSTILSKSGETLMLFLTLEWFHFFLHDYNVCYRFIVYSLCCVEIWSFYSFLRAFVMKGCWILLKAFSASIEIIMQFLSLSLFMCLVRFVDVHMFNHFCSPGIRPTWSWCMIFLMCCWIQLAGIYWEFLLMYSLRKLIHSFLFCVCPYPVLVIRVILIL